MAFQQKRDFGTLDTEKIAYERLAELQAAGSEVADARAAEGRRRAESANLPAGNAASAESIEEAAACTFW